MKEFRILIEIIMITAMIFLKNTIFYNLPIVVCFTPLILHIIFIIINNIELASAQQYIKDFINLNKKDN